jgi:transcriptional regulator GlxA family with amidase domain
MVSPVYHDPHEAEVARKIDQSILYMKEHLDRPLQASTLASRANVSLSHYFALFKRRTGATPIDYFIQLRMERACELLKQTPLAIKEIAAALGYEDPFYFSRVFKSVTTVAPREYRLSCLANPASRSHSFACPFRQKVRRDVLIAPPCEIRLRNS